MQHKRGPVSHEQSSFMDMMPKRLKTDVLLSSKEKIEKLGDRISALQQLVSPFGRTDTASVLLEAIGYIRFLHEQVKIMSAPYLYSSPTQLQVVGLRSTHIKAVSDVMDYITSVAEAEECNNVATNSKKEDLVEREKRKTGLLLNLEDLKPHFGKRLKDVAEDLGVGRSTIKRTCRNHGINRWPCNEKQKKNPSLFETEGANKILLDTPFHQNVPQTDTESTQHLTVQPKVVIKAKYGDDNVKFELCLPSGMGNILKEVALRLNLMIGSFKLKYLDEDNDEILLACDVDLQLCLKNSAAACKSYLQLSVSK